MGCVFSKNNNLANAHSPLQVRSALPEKSTVSGSIEGGTAATRQQYLSEESSLTGPCNMDKRRLGKLKRRSVRQHGHSLDVPIRSGDNPDQQQQQLSSGGHAYGLRTCRPLIRRESLPSLGEWDRDSPKSTRFGSHDRCQVAPALVGNESSVYRKSTSTLPVKRICPTHSKIGGGHDSKEQMVPSVAQQGTVSRKRSAVYDELLAISDDNLSCGSANAVCGSDVSSLGISDSEHPNMNNESTNKVDNSTQMPYRRDDGCVEVQRCKKFTDKLHHLMPRLGKALQKQCDMPNATDERNGSLVVGNDRKDDQKQTELGNRSGVNDADSFVPMTTQPSLLQRRAQVSALSCTAERPVGRRGCRKHLVLEPRKEKGLGRELAVITHPSSTIPAWSSGSTLYRLPANCGISQSNSEFQNATRNRYVSNHRNHGSCQSQDYKKEERMADSLRLIGPVPLSKWPAPVGGECRRPSNPVRKHRIPSDNSVAPVPLNKHPVPFGLECERPSNPVRKYRIARDHAIASQPFMRSVNESVNDQTLSEQNNRGNCYGDVLEHVGISVSQLSHEDERRNRDMELDRRGIQ